MDTSYYGLLGIAPIAYISIRNLGVARDWGLIKVLAGGSSTRRGAIAPLQKNPSPSPLAEVYER